MRNRHRRTPLLEAAAAGDTQSLRRWIAEGSPLDVLDSAGHSAACLAAEEGHADVLRILREHGAQIFRCEAFRDGTPLAHLKAFDHPGVIAFFFDEGARHIGQTTLEALLREREGPGASRFGVLMERLDALAGPPPHPLAEELLLAAVATDRLDLMRWLARRGVDLDGRIEIASGATTALAHAAARLRVKSVRFLLDAGASVERALGGRDVISVVGWEDQDMASRDRILTLFRDAAR